MANANGWGDGASNNNIGWGKGADNAIGWGSVYSVSEAGATDIVGTPAVDPDAQAFITAAAITDPTQQAAINTLVVDLKGYNVWTKMKALYPFVGGTNSQHTWNLKNTAQFQISWQGGVVSSANGVQFNGLNSYGITGLTPSTSLSLNSTHLGYYSRTNSNATEIEIGVQQPGGNYNILEIRTSNVTYPLINQNGITSFSDLDSLGFYLGNRTASNDIDGWKNGVKKVNGNALSNALSNIPIYIGAMNSLGTASTYTSKQCAFASIGDGLTDTEAANFYTAVQAFQTTLGRSIGTQTVSDADAQAFVTAANIQDQVEANAINNLVIGMKADGLWTKMKAVYPFVGGTAASHSYNLKNTAQYQISWNGGVSHNSNGVTFGGVNGHGDTGLVMSTVFGSGYSSYGAYIRNTLTGTNINGVVSSGGVDPRCDFGYDSGVTIPFFANGTNGSNLGTDTDTKGMLIGTRQSATVVKFFRNNVAKINTTNTFSANSTASYYIGARNHPVATQYFSNNAQMALHYISDGLTDTDATNLNTRVTTFQTALNRNI